MTPQKDMISRHLATALRETIHQHAERHHRGVMDLDRVLSALGDVTSGLLAELTNTHARVQHYRSLCSGIATATAAKILGDDKSRTKQ
jgi:hypothetical protein